MRWQARLLTVVVTCAVGSGGVVGGKAYSVRRYRGQVAALQSAGGLPSQTWATVDAAVRAGRPRTVAAARRVLGPFGTVRVVPGKLLMTNEEGVEVGDDARLGWSYRVTCYANGQSWGGGWSNEAALAPLLAIPKAIEWVRRAACWVAGVLALVLLCTAAANWQRHQRLATAGATASIAAGVLAAVSAEPAEVWITRAAASDLWPAAVLFAAGVGLACWPTRRPADGRQCRRCGYDLTGNASGVCPECGTPVPARDDVSTPSAATLSSNTSGVTAASTSR